MLGAVSLAGAKSTLLRNIQLIMEVLGVVEFAAEVLIY
jgi:hypothetical protein